MALKTLDYLFELQKQFEGKSDKLIAYYRSKLNEEFYQYKSELAIEPIQLENEGKQTKSITELQNFPGLCPKCWTPLTSLRLVPKKFLRNKKLKKEKITTITLSMLIV
ncbi:hypothetical protein SSS_00532 [Sarcoptes scabiei]|nr:hypothetical protein SSS_00532 [Sarcoptes scabiei]